MKNMIWNGALALLIGVFIVPSAALAALIVDTGTPIGGANWSLYRTADPVAGQNLAARFTLAAATSITDIEGYIGGNGGTFTISIATDDPMGHTPQEVVPGDLQQATAAASVGGVWSGLHGLSWALSPGNYWAIFSVNPGLGDTMTGGFMPNNAPSPTALEAYFSIPAFTWNRDDNLNFGVRIADNSVTPGGVPEPGTWAMMLFGFGGLGAVLRRRRGQVAPVA